MEVEATEGDVELDSAMELLKQLVPEDEVNELHASGPATLYTPYVVIWILTLQRLGVGKSQAKVVKDVVANCRDIFPDNKRLREGTISENPSAFHAATKRLKLDTVQTFAKRVSESLIAAYRPSYGVQRCFLIDGTTITLEPTVELKEAFPPATNQHGESDWPVAMLLVAHELESGIALPPEIGAMYGENNTSEAKLARRMLAQLPANSIVYADSGFGIFSVAYYSLEAGHDVLFRLTKTRFKSLSKRATSVVEVDGVRTYSLVWKPTAKDRKTNPDLPKDAELQLAMHSVPLDNGESLDLVTSLRVTGHEAADRYSRRYDVEHDIRDLKVTLDTENLRCKSVEGMKKELLTSIVAYNLVIQLRREAARLANVPPRRLSFKGVLDTFDSFLIHAAVTTPMQWQERYVMTLTTASRQILPERPGRKYPRKALPRRPKSTKFMKTERTNHPNQKNNDKTPPLVPK